MTQSLYGNLEVLSPSFLDSGYGETDSRDLNVGVTLSGDADLTVRGYNTGNTFALISTANNYTGNWTVQAAFLDARGVHWAVGILRSTPARALTPTMT